MYIATGKGKRIDCTLDRNLDGDYDRTNLNTLVLLVYTQPSDTAAANGQPVTNAAVLSAPTGIELYRYFVAPH